MKRAKYSLLAGFCLVILSVKASGAVLTYGTFTGADPNSSETLGTFDQTSGALAVGFFVNANGYTLSQVKFDLSRQGQSSARLRVYAGAPGGSALFTSGNVGLTAAAAVVTFSGLNVSLTSGQQYWLVIDANAGNGSTRVHSATGNQYQTASGTANLSMIGYRVYNEGLTSHGGTQTGDLPNFSVVVPEPHEYALVAGICLALFAIYRRRTSAT